MNSISKSKTGIILPSLTIKLNDGSNVTLGYESDVRLSFEAITKLDSSGREVALGYKVDITWDMMQANYDALAAVAGYYQTEIDLTIEGLAILTATGSEDFDIEKVKPVFEPQIRDNEYSPIRCRVTKVVDMTTFEQLLDHTA